MRRGVGENLYPINLDLEDKEILVVGAGKVAYRKLKRLVKTEAKITIVSPKLIPEIERLISDNNLSYKARKFREVDIQGQFLIFAATDNNQLNQAIADLAKEKSILVNVVDNKDISSFTLPALIRQGDLLLAFSTGGKLPALSKQIRLKLAEDFGVEFAVFLELMEEVRAAIKAEIDDKSLRRELFANLADFDLIAEFKDKELGIKRLEEILPKKVIKRVDCL